jgi:glutathione synthase/RimK-type ligase-like ATP-grasp enzyme
VPVHNATRVLRWNADKRYMLELEARGVRITPTRLAARGERGSLARLAAQTGWRHLVIKPTVASTGYQTWMTDAPVTARAEQQFGEQSQRMDLLVQEFARGVHAGELSLVFLRGHYSHAVLKRAAGSEFRVHAEHGGTVESYQPTAAQVAWAESVLHAIREPWTYARVDAVQNDEGPMLMELELLDPELFFKYHPAAAGDLIDALAVGSRAR